MIYDVGGLIYTFELEVTVTRNTGTLIGRASKTIRTNEPPVGGTHTHHTHISHMHGLHLKYCLLQKICIC